MMRVAVLILAFSCWLCEAQADKNNDRVSLYPGSTSCSDTCSLTSISQTLGAVGEKVANMVGKITHLEEKLQNTGKEVLELRSLIKGAPQVAFSAALRDSGSGNTGPISANTPLQYKRVFSNTGSGYNPSTGIFTAMVKGMYFFRFSMFNNINPHANSVVSLMKNGVRLTSVWDTSGTDSNDMGSNAAVIPLDVGDNVYVELQAHRIIYDDSMNYNTFSGFLLFTM
ncbi:complement C1q-like protein 2 [Thunnus albacares]|uniref:complement C1q-like protein 2 n=1 Tax=Thunnus albacares TaxID=8236 RepID=UPI001CF6AEF2|nr:complement C1q-like protein 2 [Thunnus albacares]